MCIMILSGYKFVKRLLINLLNLKQRRIKIVIRIKENKARNKAKNKERNKIKNNKNNKINNNKNK